MNRFLLFLSITAIISILTAYYSSYILLTLFLLFCVYLYFQKKHSNFLILAFIICFVLFFMSMKWYDDRHKSVFTGEETSFVLSIIEPPKIDGNKLLAKGKTREGEIVVIQYQLHTEQEKQLLNQSIFFNSTCLLSGVLIKPALPRNENAFNYRQYLYITGVNWILESDTINFCQRKGLSSLEKIKYLRYKGIDYINNFFPKDIKGFAAALIFGDRSGIDSILYASYQQLGIVHLLAISGLHIGLLVSVLYWCGLRLGITRERLLTILCLGLPIYMILSGASPSVIRAGSMALLVMLHLKLKRMISPFQSISIVFLVYLFYNPYLLFHAGFQLSFIVALALIISSTTLLKNWELKTIQLTIVTIVAQLASLPIILFHFYQFSFMSFVLNMVFVPFYSIIVLPGLLIGFCIHPILPTLMDIYLLQLSTLLTLANHLVLHISENLSLTLVLGKPGIILMAVYLLSIFYFLFCLESRKKIGLSFLLLLSVMLMDRLDEWIQWKGEITFIDVGQGDSILIRQPFNNGTYLIDTGGVVLFEREKWKQGSRQFDVGRDILLPFLKSKGITKIDKLILTHGDADHIQGSEALWENMSIHELVVGKRMEYTILMEEILNKVKQKGIKIQEVTKNDYWKTNTGTFTVLHPSPEYNKDDNDGSIVLLGNIAGRKWIFTGDIEKEGEQLIIEGYDHLQVDVLKVGHHGSRTSSSKAFVNHLSPKYAIISVGNKNRFGHPHKETTDLFKERKIKVFRTDSQGAITYYFMGKSGTFSTQLP